MPPLHVEFTPETRYDVRMLLHESEARWGPQQAERYSAALDAAFERIGSHPDIGSVQPDLPSVRAYPSGSHRIYYAVESDHVLILRVLHQRVGLSDADSG